MRLVDGALERCGHELWTDKEEGWKKRVYSKAREKGERRVERGAVKGDGKVRNRGCEELWKCKGKGLCGVELQR